MFVLLALVLVLVLVLVLMLVLVLVLPYFAFHISGRMNFRLAGATISGASTLHLVGARLPY